MNSDPDVKFHDESEFCSPRPTVYHSLKCPICSRHFDNEETCFEHFLDYFEHSQHFLFNRCNLVYWLNNYVRFQSKKVTMNVIPVALMASDENMNRLKTCADTENDKGPTYQCEICFESYSNEDQLGVHSFMHLKLKIPTIDSQLRCPLCEKYFCHEESCLTHIFTHMKIPFAEAVPVKIIISPSPKTVRLVKEWLTIFFSSKLCMKVLAKYCRYQERLNSPLLSKILLSEIGALKSCKFCKKSVTSVFDLLDYHRECKPNSSIFINPIYCVLCNFKAAEMDTLILHLFSDHIACYCGYTGDDFDSFLKHSDECAAHKNGVICPCCRTSNFVTEGAFKEHIEGTKMKTCGTLLKKNKWVCLICKAQCSQKGIFNHIFMNHVSCLCGYKSENMKYFFQHTAQCVIKKRCIFCPICKEVKCATEDILQQHLSFCTWKKEDHEVKKRKYEHVVVEKFSNDKKTKFSLDLNYVDCRSQ